MKKVMIVLCLFFTLHLSATIINIPTDQPTIQEGINAAVDADTVLVQPGTYIENINYNGKNITVASLFLTTQDTTYISQTIIDANHNFSVASFLSGEDSTSILTGFTITNGNVYQGGGIYCDNSSPSLINVTISGNTASDYGGGISCSSNSNPILTNVIINDNTANWGAGIYCYDNSSAILNNVVIYNNTALIEGGGILNDSCNLNITNSTITMNDAPLGAGIFCSGNSNLNILNSILWNNQPQGMYISGGTIISIYYSNYQGAGGYFGNIDEDPLFVGTGEDPYSLLENSPCIDTGIPDTLGLNLPPWDIIGNHRIWDGDGDGTAIIDMGAYEYDALPYVDIKDNVIVYTSEVFLHQNYPNPFNPITTINYYLIENSKVEINIYNIKGQKVKQLINEHLSTGQHSIIWNGTDKSNNSVSSGVYLYKLNVDGKTEAVRKCLLLK